MNKYIAMAIITVCIFLVCLAGILLYPDSEKLAKTMTTTKSVEITSTQGKTSTPAIISDKTSTPDTALTPEITSTPETASPSKTPTSDATTTLEKTPIPGVITPKITTPNKTTPKITTAKKTTPKKTTPKKTPSRTIKPTQKPSTPASTVNDKEVLHPEYFIHINPAIPPQLYNYPFSTEPTMWDESMFMSNKELKTFWENSWDKKRNFELVTETARGYMLTNFSLDYSNTKGLREKLLYYFSSSGNAEEWIDGRIDDIKKNTVRSTADFITDTSMVYLDGNSDVRVRGRLIIKYDDVTGKEFLKDRGLKSNTWYYRDLEILLTIAVDNHKWERGYWTYLGCRYLNEYTVYNGG